MQATEIIEGNLADPERFERPTLRFVVCTDSHDPEGGWNDLRPKPTEQSPNDFCRTCRGRGYLSDRGRSYGEPSTTMTCWSCNGSGYGR